MQRRHVIEDRRRSSQRRTSQRRGSTLLVVIALLGLLALLGFVFYTFAAQERSNAEYFLEGAKEDTDSGLTPDVLFDWALDQLIVGPEDNLRQSALWGRRHSLLANTLGINMARGEFKIHPYTGEGVNLIYDGSGEVRVDQNYDGLADQPGPQTPLGQQLLNFNDSPAAWGSIDGRPNFADVPDSAVDYTYPDINNLFLAYQVEALGPDNTPVEVIIPSFLRPQYMRNPGTGAVPPNWYDIADPAQLMRPHREHWAFDFQGNAVARRFIDENDPLANELRYGAFPFAPDNPDNELNQPGEMGIWTQPTDPATFASVYELDVDNTGDGKREGILMDLGFPLQELDIEGDPILAVPLFSFTVLDADALLNLNIHGNIRRDIDVLSMQPFGGLHEMSNFTGSPVVDFISKSNQGLSPAEVNPVWALTAQPDPSNDQQHEQFFGWNPQSRRELGNMEWWFLLKGRPDLEDDGSLRDIYAGRYGDLERLFQNWSSGNPQGFPQPGMAGVDDNGNRMEGGQVGATGLPFSHPLDFAGTGKYVGILNDPNSSPRRPVMFPHPDPDNPTTWLQYRRYGLAGDVRWRQVVEETNPPLNLMLNSIQDALFDDPMEIIVEQRYTQRPFDEIFSPDEMALLHLSRDDLEGNEVGSRLESLGLRNFNPEDSETEAIRKRFTTESWDRKQFNYPYLQNWLRSWEFTFDPNDGFLTFPPIFGPPGAIPPYSVNDPFRQQLRQLLEIKLQDTGNLRQQMRLSLNEVLVHLDGHLTHRALTPHPPQGALGPEPLNPQWNRNNLPPYPPQTPQQQEFWARYDRQIMARDIYVLLYTLGGGENGRNTVNTPNTETGNDPPFDRVVYGDAQLREMAQFAVNVVDALDRDNVITRFEYDKNLANGWNLDDNPYTVDPGVPPEERGEVWGVEAQQLTLSEVLAIHAMQVQTETGDPYDHPATEYDSSQTRGFAYVELRNISPATVSFQNEAWQIALRPHIPEDQELDDEERDELLDPSMERRVTIRGNLSVPPGELFTILGADNPNMNMETMQPSSYFRVDPNAGSAYQNIVPRSPTPLAPQVSLDLVDPSQQLRVTDGNDQTQANEGQEFVRGIIENPTFNRDQNYEFVLRRRANPWRQSPQADDQQQEADNPWVEVDRFVIPRWRHFDLNQNTQAEGIVNRLQNEVRSWERREPLQAQVVNSGGDPNDIRRNTFGELNHNQQGLQQFRLWQPHFDRDFASPIELLTVPLFGPDELTEKLTARLDERVLRRLSWDFLAASKFLRPEHHANIDDGLGGPLGLPFEAGGPPPTGTPLPAKEPRLDNRWYRLFEFVEVPTRTHRHLDHPFNISRVPGKINLNTVRHRDVLAGLLDDLETYWQNHDPDIPNLHLPGRFSDDPDFLTGLNRDWWAELIRSRDQYDPFTNLFLPGLAGARPFRSFNFVTHPPPSAPNNRNPVQELINHTLLRSLPIDAHELMTVPPEHRLNPRQLFQLGNWNHHLDGIVDVYTRHRLLSKVYNNTTTRSNVFIVYISVGFFEAHQTDEGVVRIGGRIPHEDLPGHRGFFIVDRSQLEEAYEPTSGRFDFRRLVIHRQTLE